jgi:prevent-host-death family protein
MVMYLKKEITASSTASKNFGEILEKLKSGKAEKIVISKNNVLEAVIIPIEEFEILKEAYEIVEHLEIFKTIIDRKNLKPVISLDELIKRNNYHRKDLQEETLL